MTATIQACVEHATTFNKSREVELLLAHVLQTSKEYVFAHPERTLTAVQLEQFLALWQRLETGEPLAYVLGVAAFFGMEFYVDPRVLIPRPETEHLVEAVLECVKDKNEVAILDVGTGCGAIALALAQALPLSDVLGTDVSADAIDVARANARHLGLEKVRFVVADLLEGVEFPADVLVTNLPYIGTKQFHFVEKSVEDHEPHVALYGGEDGLRLYARLFDQVALLAAKGPRWVIGEFGAFQREALAELIGAVFPAFSVTFYKDLAGLDRFFILDCRHAE